MVFVSKQFARLSDVSEICASLNTYGVMHKFGVNDILRNTLKTFPKQEFFIYESNVYLNNKGLEVGHFTSSVPNVPPGFVSLYEENVDRNSGSTGLIYPFITKSGARSGFKSISTTEFNSDFEFGDIITGSYPLSASCKREYYATNSARKEINALRNSFLYNTRLSPHFSYSNTLIDGGWNKDIQECTLISIPKIFFGDALKKGTVSLKYWVTGTLVGELRDERRNGELIQVEPVGHTNSGSVGGVVLYNEGFILLTGSWDLSEGGGTTKNFLNNGNLKNDGWVWWGTGMNDDIPATDSTSTRKLASFAMEFRGENTTQVMTMFVRLPKGEFNYSNNPTFISAENSSSLLPTTSSYWYKERSDLSIKNVVSGAFGSEQTASFQQVTYISGINIYDEDGNVIARANLATPICKKVDTDFVVKLSTDLY